MYGLKRVRQRRNDALTRVGWNQLEVLLATWYRGQGFDVEHTGTAASGTRYDGGIDLKLRRPGEYVLVQVKHWNVDQVPHNEVHQLLGLMVNEGATGAILITSGEFTKAAIEAATRHGHVRLIDGDELRAMLEPLPEPASPQSALAPFASRAGERLLDVAEDRIRDGGRHARRSAEVGLGLFLIKGASALVAVLFVWAAFNSVLHTLSTSLQASMQARTVRSQPAQVSNPYPSVTASAASAGLSAIGACHEVIDKPSGTYIDHCAQVGPPRPPPKKDVRPSQREADEAMKVLAPNTPEM